MAIGSAPEIGTVFYTWGDMTEEQRVAWFDHLRSQPQTGYIPGYGTIVDRVR